MPLVFWRPGHEAFLLHELQHIADDIVSPPSAEEISRYNRRVTRIYIGMFVTIASSLTELGIAAAHLEIWPADLVFLAVCLLSAFFSLAQIVGYYFEGKERRARRRE